MLEFIKEFFPVIIAIFLLMGLAMAIIGLTIGLPTYLIDKNISCPKLSESLERPTKYDFWAGGCFVQDTSGQWVRSSNYHAVDIQK